MSNEENKCPICGQDANCEQVQSHHTVHKYSECACGSFFVDRRVIDPSLRCKRLSALLRERHLQGLPTPVILYSDAQKPETSLGPVVRPSELLARWPRTVPERIDRVLCNLSMDQSHPGEGIKLGPEEHANSLCFASQKSERSYYLKALVKYGWVEPFDGRYRLTPEGWQRVSELVGGAERRRNPAFVAMSFGGDNTEDQAKMKDRFDKVIRPACYDACGWNAERVDTREHNDSIIDRVVEMIRVAPFVIADLSDENHGVYYEAGYARGLGGTVIYLVHEDCRVHFDVSGVSQVRWRTDEELRERLGNRILGTMGRGPHNDGGKR